MHLTMSTQPHTTIRARHRLRPRPQMQQQQQQQRRRPEELLHRRSNNNNSKNSSSSSSSSSLRTPKPDRTLASSLVLLLLAVSWLPHSATGTHPLRPPPRRRMEQEPKRDRCIESGPVLLQALRDYYATGRHDNERKSGSESTPTPKSTSTSAQQKYGGSIEEWCLSPRILDKLEGNATNTLGGHLARTVDNIVETHDDDGIGDLEASDLVSGWTLSALGTPCENVCGGNGNDSEPPAVKESTSVVGSSENDDDEEGGGDGFMDEFELDTEDLNYYENTHANENANENANEKANENELEVDQEEFLNELETEDFIIQRDQGDHSGSDTRSHGNGTITSMLIRVLPVKLVAFLSLMCIFLGIRQMFLSMDGDSNCWCCCKWINSFFGSRYASYEGIDPSDVSDHQKSVEFELLQLAASGEGDFDPEVVIS